MTDTPKKIGNYSIKAEVGRGGMGVVYKAIDSRLSRAVAIKTLPGHLAANSEYMERFEREAQTLAALNHPNIGGIHGIEDHDGRKHLILEYVDGDTLADRIARGPLRVGEALEVGFQIADALTAAHDAGFIHRDLKPANIKISSTSVVKVLDFGLARAETTNSEKTPTNNPATQLIPDPITSPGLIVGTMSYMSPEQVRGEVADRRADLWALGVVLYECLTGVNPFAKESGSACMSATLNHEPNLELLPPFTPFEVVAMIRRCLSKNKNTRQRDAGDCRLILEDARDGLLKDPAIANRVVEISDRSFTISDDICRELDRNEFDALLPGWEMRYADNNRESDTLIVWIPSLGGDHTTTPWRQLIAAAPHRMVSVSLVGMEPGVPHHPVVSLENQFALVRALVRHLRSSLAPKRTIISGLSCGGILALRCAAGDEGGELFDGVLAIDADLQQSDCFMTRLFAGLDASSTSNVMTGIQAISASCETIEEWLVLHQHMIEFVGKVRSDFSPLIRQGQQLSEAYEGVHTGADSPFVGFLREAMARVDKVRCVFDDNPENRRILGEIRMMHLDSGVLGPTFCGDTISFLAANDDLGLLKTELLLAQLDATVAAVGGSAAGA